MPSKYDLVANLVHEGKAGQGQGVYRVHVHRKASGRGWMGAEGEHDRKGSVLAAAQRPRWGAPRCPPAQGAPQALQPRATTPDLPATLRLIAGARCKLVASRCLLIHPNALCACLPACWQVEEQWYEVQDLRVTEVLPQMVALSETYAQVFELKQ